MSRIYFIYELKDIMPTEIENINPSVYGKIKKREVTANEEDETVADPFDKREIFGKHIGERKSELKTKNNIIASNWQISYEISTIRSIH